MFATAHPALSPLSIAERARTALASCSSLRWCRDGRDVAVPFVEEAGSLLLIVDDELLAELLARGAGSLEVDVAPAIGSVRLSGDFWPVASTVATGIIDDLRACHQECADCPGRRLSRVVGLQIDRVELKPLGGGFERVDLDDYVLARPDWMLALGVQVRGHLNGAHADAVLAAAAALTRQRLDTILTAEVAWVDGSGFELSIIDVTGGRRVRCDLPDRVTVPEGLSDAVHAAVERFAADAVRPPAD